MSILDRQNGKWSESDMPDQTGRVVLVTGASSGIGLEAARSMAGRGARVLLGCRNREKADRAVADIRASVRELEVEADIEIIDLDLADLASVRRAADEVGGTVPALDILINNAGVMAIPRQLTVDGFEMQFGTNHLGHFALTGLLFDSLSKAAAARVVNVSSTAHRMGRILFDDLAADDSYHRWLRYGQSKVANLLFTYEMQRRLEARTSPIAALACHPGGARSDLARDAGALMRFFQPAADIVMQSSAMGALPTLRAATDPAARGGQFYGPDGITGVRGHPVTVHSSAYSHRRDVATRLWAVSEELTGVSWLD